MLLSPLCYWTVPRAPDPTKQPRRGVSEKSCDTREWYRRRTIAESSNATLRRRRVEVDSGVHRYERSASSRANPCVRARDVRDESFRFLRGRVVGVGPTLSRTRRRRTNKRKNNKEIQE